MLCADDIALLSSKFNDLREKIGRLTEEAAKVSFKLNAGKCRTLSTEFAGNRENIVVNAEPLRLYAELGHNYVHI